MDCPACRCELPPDARFCPSCGSPCTPPGPAGPAEGRKLVTVLFCDLVGSTALSGALDPETLRSVTLRYFELMRRQIEAHGGTLEKFIGDAVMAVFGVPTVREDDARRALAAALGMLDALSGLNTELAATLGVRLDVRIGVNTGQVVAGSDASARQALVAGETVNIAARLEQNAGPGQILIGPDTLRAAGPTVRTESVGPLLLKGKADAVTAHRLLGLGADDPELLRRFDVRFVGRHAELAELDAALARTADGRGAQCLLVHGEAGQGKTRLLREWLERTAPLAAYGTGRCRPYGGQGSLQPLADALRGLLGEALLEGAAEALAVLSTGLLRDGTPNPSVAETCAALIRVLTALAGRRPVVLAIDDCHWAGPLLLDVLDRLAAELGPASVLLICLTRPELLESRPLAATGAIGLSGLSEQEARLLAAELVDVNAHWDGAPAGLLERAGGNPLHLEQLLAVGSETESPGELPPTVQALLGARIDTLEPAERLALDLASVVGREFTAEELAELAQGRDPVRSALPALSHRRLIEPARPAGPARPVFRFTSGLVQEVAYECMSKRARAEVHQRAAGLPSVRAAGDGAVGTHLEQAHRYRSDLGLLDGDTETLRGSAARTLARAGAQAMAGSDLSRAEDLLARAMALGRPGEPAGIPTARRLGEVRIALGRTVQGRSLLTDVLSAPADPVDHAHARLALAVLDPLAGAGRPVEAARAALPVFEAANDQLGQARARLRLAQHHQAHGRHGAADALLTRALSHAASVDGEVERAAALGAIGISLWRGPTPVPAAAVRCQALLAEHGRGRRTVRVTLNCPMAVLLALQDEPAAAREHLAEAGRLARELGYAEAEVFLPVFAALIEVLTDRQNAALELLAGAADAARRLGAGALLDTITLDSARLLLDTGQWAAAENALRPLAAKSGRPHAESVDLDGLRGRLAAAQGQAERAVRLAGCAVAEATLTDSPVVRAQAALDQAHTLRLLGRGGPAAEAAAAARAWFAAKGHQPGVRWVAAFNEEN
ncbi:adenylate/guanylate cyclase domain-containing protein [Kitasatospora sp. NPDC001175]|uniref:adenylate/guanylate cyclase domain-containing protein n=1 Tax=Kitasatospora sp. NPDC001175 TaxID=3157103 RepID=UPI003D05818D